MSLERTLMRDITKKLNENIALAVDELDNFGQTAEAKSSGLELTNLVSDCRALAGRKYGNPMSPYITARLKAGYFSPEDQYEALMNRSLRKQLLAGCRLWSLSVPEQF